tara:strand:+ start:556 stop:1020 length:465 start_codon:yes stop_codon:yes gene_type:complete
MKTLLILISFIFITNSSVVHQDTILRIDENGNIIGLPKEFGVTKFDLNKKYLRIKDKEIVFPSCMNYYFDIHEKPKLKLSASWYHSKDIMPYYLNFDISQKNKDFGYTILIDLETLEIIDIEVSINQGNSTYNHEIKLDDHCLTEYKKEIKTLK